MAYTNKVVDHFQNPRNAGSLNKESNLVNLPFFLGKKPSKTNLSHAKSDWINAGINAVGPGRQDILIPNSRHFLIIKNPGSEIPGVPESEIKQLFLTDRILEMI